MGLDETALQQDAALAPIPYETEKNISIMGAQGSLCTSVYIPSCLRTEVLRHAGVIFVLCIFDFRMVPA